MPFDTLDFLFRAVGWIGAVEVVVAYLLVSTQKIRPTQLWYFILNFSGSICLVINTAYLKSYPSTILNLVWAIIALYTILPKTR